MLPEENEVYGPSYQQGQFESVAVLEDATATHAPAEQDTSPLPLIPPGPKAPLPPQNRQGRGGAILLFTLVLAIIFGVGLFAGLEYAGSTGSTSRTATTTKSVVTTPTTASSGSTIEALQEAAIAKIEPAVVELDVTTTQGEQIGSGVIIDTKGDIVTNYHIVNGEESITAVLYNGGKVQAQLVGTNTADDLAVVRIQPFANMTVAQIGDSSRLVVGQEVVHLVGDHHDAGVLSHLAQRAHHALVHAGARRVAGGVDDQGDLVVLHQVDQVGPPFLNLGDDLDRNAGRAQGTGRAPGRNQAVAELRQVPGDRHGVRCRRHGRRAREQRPG